MQNFINNFASLFWNKVNNNYYDKIIFLCIGTDRVIGDSFGPLVGENLKNLLVNQDNVEVLGDLNNIICINDINNIVYKIKETSKRPFIIGIDAALDKEENIGQIFASNKGIKVGSGLNKSDLQVGDISIKGVVSYNTKVPENNFRLLQNTRLSLIIQMANSTADAIYNVINE